jgi:hypothetical protein
MEIKIDYKPDEEGKFGKDEISINIKNVSTSALVILKRELKNIYEKHKDEDSFNWMSYADLCFQLNLALEKEKNIKV